MKLTKPLTRDEDVTTFQRLVTAAGQDCGVIDGLYGSKCVLACKAFQRAQELVADGICGPRTWAALQAKRAPGTAHFNLEEFKCKDGTEVPAPYYGNLACLMTLLEEIRKACGHRPIVIQSGYRTQSHNIKCGGAPQSQHLTANAADIKVKGMQPEQVYGLCDRLVGDRGGVGKYESFTHVDIRGYKARW